MLYILCGCTTTKEYHQTFKGVSQHWVAEFTQDATVIFKDHKELKNQNEIEYEKNELLRLRYIGKESNLGKLVEYSSRQGSGWLKASDGEVIEADEIITHSSGTSGTSHFPKDIEFEAVNSKKSVLEVIVKWNGKEEKIQLKYDE